MSDGVLFWSVAVVAVLGCIVAPFVVAVTVGAWFGFLAGTLGYAALISLVLIDRHRRG